MHVPEGWKIVCLDDISQVTSGGTPDRGNLEYWENGTIPWVTTGEISFSEITYTREKITELGLKSSAAKVFPKGAILMAMYGQGKTRGQVAKLGIDASTNQACAAIILKSKYDCNFYFQFLCSKYDQLRSIGNEGTQKNLNGGLIKEILVPVPPYLEQQKITQILSTWDKAIEKLETLIATKQKRKKALMQQLLTGKKRFAEFDGDWKEVELGKLFKEVKDKVGTEQVIPHSITAGTGFVSHEEKWGKDISGSQYENYTLLRKGQFSYNKGNSKRYACGCMYLLKHADEIAVPNVFISFERRNENFCNEFFEQYFMADYCARELRKYITSGARSDGLLNLNKADFFSIKVPLPGFNEQQKIASVLTAADTEIETHQKQLAALKQQKKGLMQQLLTGKKRVKVDGHV